MKEIQIECPDCKGTGLYQGMAERDKSAVVCYKCKGTGHTTIKYNEFTGLKKMENVERVFLSSHGYVITHEDVTTSDGVLLEFSKYGCTYKEWQNGVTPKPMEQLICPYMFDNRGVGNEPFLECKTGRGWGGHISDCNRYDRKSECWKRWNNDEAYKYEEDE